jgi:competence protein ComEA
MCCLIVTGCTTLPRRALQTSSNLARTPQDQPLEEPSDTKLIDINHATQSELERLPGIGAGYAARIIEHRARYGKFRRKEQLLIVPGIGEKRFRKIEKFIMVSDE